MNGNHNKAVLTICYFNIDTLEVPLSTNSLVKLSNCLNLLKVFLVGRERSACGFYRNGLQGVW